MATRQQEQRTLFEVRRTLTTLGVETRFTARGDALKGALVLGPEDALANPLGGAPLSALAFTVAADGTLRIDDPPTLRGLTSPDCAKSYSVARLLAPLREELDTRALRLATLAGRLRALGLEPRPDPDRLLFEARVDLDTLGVAVLEAGCDGVLARQLVPAFGDRTPLALDDVRLDLDAFGDRVDLELHLSQCAESVVARRRTSQGSPQASVPAVAENAVLAPESSGTAALGAVIDVFGADSVLAPGATLQRRLVVSGALVDVQARYEGDHAFSIRIERPGETPVDRRAALEDVGDLEAFVRATRQGAMAPEARPRPRELEAEIAPALVAGLLPPVANEIWVLEVQVEEDDGHEVRYRGVNIGGTTFGAPRVLPKAAFESAYEPVARGYRMLVQVVCVDDREVTYQRLDARREVVGTPKCSPLVVFLANFTAEAAAY